MVRNIKIRTKFTMKIKIKVKIKPIIIVFKV